MGMDEGTDRAELLQKELTHHCKKYFEKFVCEITVLFFFQRVSREDLILLFNFQISGSPRHVRWAIYSHFKQQASTDPWKSSLCICERHFTANSDFNGLSL